jgi:uncharacterized protein (DUF924 family)
MNIEQVITFWFGSDINNPDVAKNQSALWWQKSPQTDSLIRQKFAGGLKDLALGHWDDWLETPRGRLAAIIVLDQFSRNMYRDTPQAFAQDSLALKWCLEGMRLKHDVELPFIGRVFFYLPLEHAESMEMQTLSVQKFTDLAERAGADESQTFMGFQDFAERHLEVIEQFGRYPHRNRILGRESTADELAFIEQPGSGF